MDTEITTREAAERLGVSQRNVVRYISRGSLPARRVWENGPYLVKVVDVDAITPGRSPVAPLLTEEFLKGVARDYYDAKLHGESPRQALANTSGRSLSTIDYWLAKAREQGFLER